MILAAPARYRRRRTRSPPLNDFNPQQSTLARLLSTTWPLFRAFRVDVRVSWTILVIPLVFAASFPTWMTAGEVVGWSLGWTIALFTTVWVHEMGHITMGRRCGIETETMTLRALGGLAHMGAPAQTPGDEIKIALAGPATHLLWMALLYPALWILEGSQGGALWYGMLDSFAHLQLSLMIFNLLPVYPLDGGRTLRGALALRMHANRASLHVATVGFIGNGLFIAVGALAWLKIADPLGYGRFSFVLILLGLEGIQACRQLRFQARYGDIYGDHDPFQRTLLASQAAVREMENEENEERAARQAARDERRVLQETVDRLLDRINEAGGIDKLTPKERRELERASKALAERT